MKDVVGTLQPKVTGSMNSDLLKPYTKEEIQQALFQMQPMKVPGPDGMPPVFFQKYQHIVGDLVTKTVFSLCIMVFFPTDLNETFIIFILKKRKPKQITEHRPISLFNIVYKVTGKVIANRLKLILPHVISES